jgi:hypothetical protein
MYMWRMYVCIVCVCVGGGQVSESVNRLSYLGRRVCAYPVVMHALVSVHIQRHAHVTCVYVHLSQIHGVRLELVTGHELFHTSS